MLLQSEIGTIRPKRSGRSYRSYPRREYYGDRSGPNCYYNGCCPQGMTIQNGVCQPYRGP